MLENSYIYAALGVSLLTSIVGAAVSGYLFWKIWKRGQTIQVHVAWLLFVISAMSVAQLVEQGRVLIFRLSFDGLLDRSVFGWVYDGVWHVVLSKMLFSVSLAAGTALMLALHCERRSGEIARFAIGAGALTVIAWIGLEWLLNA